MKSSDKPKLIIAIVLFVAAAVVILWSLGVFSGGGSAPPATGPAEGAPVRPGGARTAPK